MKYLVLCSALLPIAAALWRLAVPKAGKRASFLFVILPILLSSALNALLWVGDYDGEQTLFALTDDIRIVFRADALSHFFSVLVSVAFLLVAVYALSYFENDGRKNRFECFFLLSYGALILLGFSGNLVTMYFNFEAVTLCSMPLVLHEKTKESIDAALKYLLYSVGGAFLGFIGVVYLQMNATADGFALGGILKDGAADGRFFGVIVFLMLVGFCAKCGLFPLHNWLPTAHPVAPAPASALLSGVITKSGVVAVIRIVFYTVGADTLRGTWMHTAWLWLILTTVLLGSMMAAVQKNFKKRLAFSTVSQVSYVLLGLATLNVDGTNGAILQICSHAAIKICLFLVAGVLIHLLGIHDVDEMDGVGRRAPVTMWCYTVCSLGLVGVPPTGGFTAKWYLAVGALEAELGVLSVLAPVVLILSAILTAYYLLAPAIAAFFPADHTAQVERVKEPVAMVLPLLVLAVLSVLVGLFPDGILSALSLM